MGVAASCSPSSSKIHEVFMSFRGEDTRRTFTSHLYTALCLRGIETFIDNGLPKGDDISQSLIQAIQDSSVSVIVFSENYASSKWCLNELIEILRCKEERGQLVVPIFYQVDPSHVRNQREAYEEAFAEHLKKNPEKVDQWRHALFETANLVGWDSSNCRDDAELIQNIVNDIIEKLNHGPSSVSSNIVGIDENCDDIELLLEEFSRIGIWGMGGIGKTTMAKVVFAKFRSQFDICCFLQNFKESDKHGVKYVRDKLFNELLKDTSLERLRHKKVLIVLDDVTNAHQLDDLQNEAPLLGPGSKVIITSRDKHVLNGRVEKIHKAKALSYNNSLKLFNLKAFREDGYKSEYKEVVEEAVAYAQGNPLALTILGSLLHSKTVKEWKSALRKLRRTADQDIQAVLKLSYDGLDYQEKEIFLDIACFFKGQSKEFVIAMLESSDFAAVIGLRTLMDKALISLELIDSYYLVQMHDLIQSMAFEIVRQECVKNPGGRSRLWDPDEIYDVLKNNRGTDAIEGISLDLSQIRDLQLSADAFRKMTNLRFLKFYSPRHRRSCTVNLPSGLESFSSSLRYLQWDNFPSESLPLSSFGAEKLVEFHMPNSHFKKLWDGVQNLVNLRKIDLRGSKELIELPDLSTAQNLEEVDLYGCESLCHLHPFILSLPRLRFVILSFCKSLRSLKAESPSKSITWLSVTGCSGLKEISFSSDKITDLHLDGDDMHVEVLDFSIGPMEKLEWLTLNVSPLRNLLINDICCMRSLHQLDLYDCEGIIDKSKLHTLFDTLLHVTSISLHGPCKLTELPSNIKHLPRLYDLSVSNCKSLQSLPELPPSIRGLHALNCTSLKTLQLTSHTESSLLADKKELGSMQCFSDSYLKNLQSLSLTGCEQLYELPEFIGSLSSLSSLNLSGSNVESLPASIKHLSDLKHIYLRCCRRLRSLPELPPFIITFHANDCLSLENHSLSCVMKNAYLSLKRLVYTKEGEGQVCYPGRKAPQWFKTEASNCITIELPSATNNIIGFVLCAVLSHHSYNECWLGCRLNYDGKHQDVSSAFDMGEITFDSHHVFLWHIRAPFINFHETMDDQNPNYRTKVSCEFSVDGFGQKVVDDVIEACGVCPIYASEYNDFIQLMELKSNVGTQKETCHGAEENSFHGILKYAYLSFKQGKGGNFEGSIIPEWFPYKSLTINYDGLEVSVRLAPDFDNLRGFIFCFVIPHFSSKEKDQCHSSCECLIDFGRDDCGLRDYRGLTYPIRWHYSMKKLNSNNVFIWFDPLYCVLKRLQELKRLGEGNYDELVFQFYFGDGLIKECGVRPIYALEYREFLQQNKLELST